MRRPALLLAFSLAIIGSSSGCSWIFVQPLPDRYDRSDVVTCTTNPTAPVLDTLFTGTNVASAIYVATQDNVSNKAPAVILGLAVGVVWLSSAIYGYGKISECREAMEGVGYRPLPRPLRPPPPVGYPQPPPAESPSTASPGQQEDDDDPGYRTAPKPSRSPGQKPDMPRFGG